MKWICAPECFGRCWQVSFPHFHRGVIYAGFDQRTEVPVISWNRDKRFETYSILSTIPVMGQPTVSSNLTLSAIKVCKAFVLQTFSLPCTRNVHRAFGRKVMCLDCDNLVHSSSAHVYRVGVANAADRGLDMYSNWGPAIQIKRV